jgi:beta-galactosidase
MAHGGTNFGLWNGANQDGDEYRPAVTSYDYDAPISEDGRLTPKFWKFREVLGKYQDLPAVPDDLLEPRRLPEPLPVPLSLAGRLLEVADALSGRQAATLWPPRFEDISQITGFLLHRRGIPVADRPRELVLHGVADRAIVFAGGVEVGTVCLDGPGAVVLPAGGTDAITLDILVENTGRVNFGPALGDHKGITGGIQLDGAWLQNWHTYGLSFDGPITQSSLPAEGSGLGRGPAFYCGEFELSEAGAVSFVDTSGLGKGIVWVNGFCLGRYWSVGPQRALYVPASLLREGRNEVVLLELHPPRGGPELHISLAGSPNLGPPAPWQPPKKTPQQPDHHIGASTK